MAAEYGFVYFLSNKSMPGLFKIGFSEKHPEIRAMELSKATGCPTPFEVMFYFGCKNPMMIERYLHDSLDAYRVNQRREFFELEEMQIHEEVASLCEEFPIDSNCFLYDYPYARYVNREKNLQDDIKWKIEHFCIQSCEPIEWYVTKGFS